MFLNSFEQLLRRKLLLVAFLAAVAFLALYWWGVSSAAEAINSSESKDPMMASFTTADSALAAIFTAGPMVATLITSLVIILGASILPDEIAAGRMSLWTSLPQTRLRTFLGTTFSPLAASIALGYLLFGGTALITNRYFPFTPTNALTALVSLPVWLMVCWSAVVTLSLLLKKIPVAYRLLARWMRTLARFVPAEDRSRWCTEWDGELWYAVADKVGARCYRIVFALCVGMLRDSLEIRRLRKLVRLRKLSRTTRSWNQSCQNCHSSLSASQWDSRLKMGTKPRM